MKWKTENGNGRDMNIEYDFTSRAMTVFSEIFSK